MRGDRPFLQEKPHRFGGFTPHARGSTPLLYFFVAAETVYPACAGIDPIKITEKACTLRLPRMRGDRPCFGYRLLFTLRFTPHARGSTY